MFGFVNKIVQNRGEPIYFSLFYNSHIEKKEHGKNESYDNALTAYETKIKFLQELKVRIADKNKRCFDALQFADKLEDITDISFSEDLCCSLIDDVSVPTGGKK